MVYCPSKMLFSLESPCQKRSPSAAFSLPCFFSSACTTQWVRTSTVVWRAAGLNSQCSLASSPLQRKSAHATRLVCLFCQISAPDFWGAQHNSHYPQLTGSFFKHFFTHRDANILTICIIEAPRAYSIAVIHVHGMDEFGVRLPVGPQPLRKSQLLEIFRRWKSQRCFASTRNREAGSRTLTFSGVQVTLRKFSDL